MQEKRDDIKVAARGKNVRATAVIVCLFIIFAAAIGLTAGYAGYAAGKNDTTVIYYRDGGTVSDLSPGGEQTVARVVESVADSVVEINCTVETTTSSWGGIPVTKRGTSAGSGVIISADGTIITNHHVTENAVSITVRLRGGQTYTASTVGSDPDNDIAVLRMDRFDTRLTCAVFGSSASLKVGQPVVVIGNPLGTLGGTVTDGIISALDRDVTVEGKTMRLLQTNASINSGNSGGGMFDMDGRLIGIVNAKSTGDDVEGLGFAIPADTAYKAVTDILAN